MNVKTTYYSYFESLTRDLREHLEKGHEVVVRNAKFEEHDAYAITHTEVVAGGELDLAHCLERFKAELERFQKETK